MENWRRRRVEGPVAFVAAAAVRAVGVRRTGSNWNRDALLLAGLGTIEGRWMIVRRVRRVREESKGGILVVVGRLSSFWKTFKSVRRVGSDCSRRC